MIFPLILAELGTLHANLAMQHKSVSRSAGWPTLNLLRKSYDVRYYHAPYRLQNAANGCLVA